jgi:hypothetical protein
MSRASIETTMTCADRPAAQVIQGAAVFLLLR